MAVNLAAMLIAKGPVGPEVDQCLEADAEADAGEDGRAPSKRGGPVRQVSRCVQPLCDKTPHCIWPPDSGPVLTSKPILVGDGRRISGPG